MSITVHLMEQRTDAWYAARCGRLTSSVANDIMPNKAKGKEKEEKASRRDLRVQLALERLTGQPEIRDFKKPWYMQHGIDEEGAARQAYEAYSGRILRTTGFISHNDLMIGCSLDGHIGEFNPSPEGIIEAKAPKSATHWSYLRAEKVPAEYVAQIAHQLWITGAPWCDFISFDSRFPVKGQRFVVRVTPKDVDVQGYQKIALAFLKEVDDQVQEMRTLFGVADVLREAVA